MVSAALAIVKFFGLAGRPVVLCSRMKQYRRELSHDGIYAEATLVIRDGEVK